MINDLQCFVDTDCWIYRVHLSIIVTVFSWHSSCRILRDANTHGVDKPSIFTPLVETNSTIRCSAFLVNFLVVVH